MMTADFTHRYFPSLSESRFYHRTVEELQLPEGLDAMPYLNFHDKNSTALKIKQQTIRLTIPKATSTAENKPRTAHIAIRILFQERFMYPRLIALPAIESPLSRISGRHEIRLVTKHTIPDLAGRLKVPRRG
jgi:hypothetical protein